MARGIERTRPTEIVTHTETVTLSFNIVLSSIADSTRALVSNIGRVIMKNCQLSSTEMLYLTQTILMCLHATKTCGRQSQKSGTQ